MIGWILSVFGSRKDLVLENLALRQQLLALHTKRPRRLSVQHKLFWVWLIKTSRTREMNDLRPAHRR